jgi:hypothetical protein
MVNVDNQAALQAIDLDMMKPGQHIAATIHQIIKQLQLTSKNSRFKLTFRWSMGHVGIEGNEEADKEANQEEKVQRKLSYPPTLANPSSIVSQQSGRHTMTNSNKNGQNPGPHPPGIFMHASRTC